MVTGDKIERSSPSVGRDGTVYVASLDTLLYAVTNGSVKWTCPVGNWCYSSPAVGPDNTIYIGGESDHRIYAITNGAVKWSYLTGGILIASPAIGSNNVVYMGSADGHLYALTNGAVKWSFDANTGSGMEIYSSAVLGPDETVYFGTLYPWVGDWYGELFAVKEGIKKWSYKLPHWIYTSAPAIDRQGNLVVGCIDYSVYCIGQTPEPSFSANQTADTSAFSVNRIVAAPNPWRTGNAAGAHYIEFFNLPSECGIDVFSCTGMKIFTAVAFADNGRYRWYLQDGKGSPVPSGVYFFRFEDPSGAVNTLTITVIR